MLILLFLALGMIHLTQMIGTAASLCLLVSGWSLFWWTRLYSPTACNPAMPMSLMWMCLIALAYGIIHDHQITRVREQLQAWNQANVRDTTDSGSIQAWKPIVVQGVVRQTLRYRRASIQQRPGSEDSQIDDWQTLTSIEVSKIQKNDAWQDLALLASVVIEGRLSGLFPGDRVKIYGQWRRPPEPSNPGQFDLRNRYAELGLAAQIKSDSTDSIALISPGSSWRLDRWLAIWTHHALLAIEKYVRLGQAPLTAALVLGQREQADWQFQEQMLATGTIHMLSISGMHIEMVALTLLIAGWMLRLPKGIVLLGTVCVCTLYAILCGANPPVARATIMLGAACLARFLGWASSSLNILAFAALVILLQRTSVAFEVGTQLSFLTVAVLILTFPIFHHRSVPIERLIESKENWLSKSLRGLRSVCWESMRSSFWVSFISAPLVWYSFHIISPISVVLNLLLWLPMLIALLAGLGLVLFFWLPPLAWIFGTCCGISLWILRNVVAIADRIPYGHFWATAPPDWWLVGFYIMALAITAWLGTRRSGARRSLLLGLGCWFALGPLWIGGREAIQRWNLLSKQASLEITFLDVGHGTCVLVQSPDGRNWLYDAGRLGDHQRSYQPIAQALWAIGIARIDGLMLSHADSDHYNAMESLLERFRVDRFITTRQVAEHTSPSLRALIDRIESRKIPIEYWHSGSELQGTSDYSIAALFPNRNPSSQPIQLASSSTRSLASKRMSDNATSLCLVVEFARRRILLPGDLETPGTEILTAGQSASVDVLMAPHHGSLTTDQDGLIAWCQPSTIVISGSHRSLDPRVFEVYSPSGQRVLHTARDHAIRLRIEPDGSMHWSSWVHGSWQTIDDRTDRTDRTD
jgi:competence protein ComEC